MTDTVGEKNEASLLGESQLPDKAPDVPAAASSQEKVATKEQDKTSSDSAQKSRDQENDAQSVEEQLRKYKWYKCKADPASYGEGHFYYTQTDTGESSWTEPQEPYWIWNTETGSVDSDAGLQYPGQSQVHEQSQQQEPSIPEGYQGYNPKIHGSYDPNADYAKFHTRQSEFQSYSAESNAHAVTPGADPALDYASTMTLNRFTGRTQTGDRGPERHSDAAKSSRQMNAFFDVDAAANAHDGRSLKAERQAQKLTKQQIKEFNAKRAERKHKKRMQQLLS